MPISDLGGWMLPSQPCFQVYGTKRKNTENEDEMTAVVQPEPLVFPFAKRRCFLPNQNQQEVNTDTSFTNNLEMMDNTVDMEATSIEHQQPSFQQFEMCPQKKLESQEFGRQRELLIKRTEKLEEQLKFIQEQEVESNDYWAAPSDSQLTMQDELEQARIQMESDFAPDPYQYSQAGPDTLPMMGYDVRTKVRCYCKPTWEGVMNQNCYI
ncbi:uncharacterized protein [Antedon mediterranea]|uniref:uncharacterized protein n=1 Tax=Antedon mediterranea TaxID=105859 RepID=UPI003AF8799F